MKDFKSWIVAAGIRALKTFAQTMIAAIGTTALIEQVNWPVVFSTAGLAALLSILTSMAGLPEVKEKKVIEEMKKENDEDADR